MSWSIEQYFTDSLPLTRALALNLTRTLTLTSGLAVPDAYERNLVAVNPEFMLTVSREYLRHGSTIKVSGVPFAGSGAPPPPPASSAATSATSSIGGVGTSSTALVPLLMGGTAIPATKKYVTATALQIQSTHQAPKEGGEKQFFRRRVGEPGRTCACVRYGGAGGRTKVRNSFSTGGGASRDAHVREVRERRGQE